MGVVNLHTIALDYLLNGALIMFEYRLPSVKESGSPDCLDPPYVLPLMNPDLESKACFARTQSSRISTISTG